MAHCLSGFVVLPESEWANGVPTNLKRIQVCEALKPEAFKLIDQYLHSNPDTELRLFSVLAAKSCFDDLWPLAHLSGLKKLAIELVQRCVTVALAESYTLEIIA